MINCFTLNNSSFPFNFKLFSASVHHQPSKTPTIFVGGSVPQHVLKRRTLVPFQTLLLFLTLGLQMRQVCVSLQLYYKQDSGTGVLL